MGERPIHYSDKNLVKFSRLTATKYKREEGFSLRETKIFEKMIGELQDIGDKLWELERKGKADKKARMATEKEIRTLFNKNKLFKRAFVAHKKVVGSHRGADFEEKARSFMLTFLPYSPEELRVVLPEVVIEEEIPTRWGSKELRKAVEDLKEKKK